MPRKYSDAMVAIWFPLIRKTFEVVWPASAESCFSSTRPVLLWSPALLACTYHAHVSHAGSSMNLSVGAAKGFGDFRKTKWASLTIVCLYPPFESYVFSKRIIRERNQALKGPPLLRSCLSSRTGVGPHLVTCRSSIFSHTASQGNFSSDSLM